MHGAGRCAWLPDFAKNRRGGIMVMVGAAIIPLVAILGLAADSGRGYLARSSAT